MENDEVYELIKKFLPSEHVKTVFDIDPVLLKEKGIKGIITDLDNTLVPWDVADATPEVIEWLDTMKEHGLKVTIISNNNEERVKIFSEPLNIPFLPSARKPLKRTFNMGARLMELKNNEIAVVGDQLLTDILGGNLAGFHTILVVPIVQTDALITRFNRKVERTILNYLRKKGMISWEE
jgi:HAD superfamily phosphatase (TIGR01668 family)